MPAGTEKSYRTQAAPLMLVVVGQELVTAPSVTHVPSATEASKQMFGGSNGVSEYHTQTRSTPPVMSTRSMVAATL